MACSDLIESGITALLFLIGEKTVTVGVIRSAEEADYKCYTAHVIKACG